MAYSFCIGMCKPINEVAQFLCRLHENYSVCIFCQMKGLRWSCCTWNYTHTWQESSLASALLGYFNSWYNTVSAYKEFHINFWCESSKIFRAGA